MSRISTDALDRIFINARTYNGWQNKPVEESLLREIYHVAKMGPTSANTCPMRIIFVSTPEGKARLKPALDAGNVAKTMAAPVTAIIAADEAFYEQLPKLFPQTDARSWFVGNQPLIDKTAFRNSSLQGAYFMIAARAFGLDCGPMSGFDNKKVDAEFFPNSSVKSNFICNLGYGDPASLHPRNPRLSFEEVCRVV